MFVGLARRGGMAWYIYYQIIQYHIFVHICSISECKMHMKINRMFALLSSLVIIFTTHHHHQSSLFLIPMNVLCIWSIICVDSVIWMLFLSSCALCTGAIYAVYSLNCLLSSMSSFSVYLWIWFGAWVVLTEYWLWVVLSTEAELIVHCEFDFFFAFSAIVVYIVYFYSKKE